MLAPSRVRNRMPQLTIFRRAWSSIGQAWPDAGLTSTCSLPLTGVQYDIFNSQAMSSK